MTAPTSVRPAQAGGWLIRQWSAFRPRRETVGPLTILLIATVLLWSIPAWAHFATTRLSLPGDPESFAFYMSWNLHALTHLQDPFFTPNLYAPFGQDLSNGITLPVVGLLMSPVTALWGGTAAYNVALLIAIFMAGGAVFLLARELTGSVPAGLGVGVLMLVSPYISGHALGHLNLLWIFGLPYLGYLTVRLVQRTVRPWLAAIGVALTFLLTAGASTELAVTETLFAGIALVVALLVAAPPLRRQLLQAGRPVLTGLAGGVLLASPIFYVALRNGLPHVSASWPGHYSTDLSNLITPSGLALVGQITSVTSTWTSNITENTAFVPLPMLLFVLVYAGIRRTRLVTGALVFAVIALVLSCGPKLHVAGHTRVWMPWALFMKIPGLSSALPNRFTAFMFVALLIVLADALNQARTIRRVGAGVAATSFVLLLPNLWAIHPSPSLTYQLASDASVARFVSSGDLQKHIAPNENVLVLPAGQAGPGMLWLAETDFYFRTPTGNGGGGTVLIGLQDPVAHALYTGVMTFDYKTKLRSYLRRVDVHAVVVPLKFVDWKAAMDNSLGVPSVLVDDVWVYRLS